MGQDFDTETNVVDVYINHLRNKIDKDPEKRSYTVRGVGYVLKRVDSRGVYLRVLPFYKGETEGIKKLC